MIRLLLLVLLLTFSFSVTAGELDPGPSGNSSGRPSSGGSNVPNWKPKRNTDSSGPYYKPAESPTIDTSPWWHDSGNDGNRDIGPTFTPPPMPQPLSEVKPFPKPKFPDNNIDPNISGIQMYYQLLSQSEFFTDANYDLQRVTGPALSPLNFNNDLVPTKLEKMKTHLDMIHKLSQLEPYFGYLSVDLKVKLSDRYPEIMANELSVFDKAREDSRLKTNEQFIRVNQEVTSLQDFAEDTMEQNHQEAQQKLYQNPFRQKIEFSSQRAEELAVIENRFPKGNLWSPQEQTATNIGYFSLELADQFYGEGDTDSGSTYENIAMAMADISLGFIPVVGWGRDVYEAISGESLLTGEPLDSFVRGLAIAGAFSAGVGSKMGLGAKLIAGIADQVPKMAKGLKDAMEMAQGVFSAAQRIGIRTKEGIKDFTEFIKRTFGNEIGAVGKEIGKLIDNGRDSYKPVENMKQFFSTEFGSALSKFSKKSNRIMDGQSVYKVTNKVPGMQGLRKGDQFYLDGMHKDHFEVFSKNGVVKFIMNLDGKINWKKTQKAIEEGRRL